jgi:hypothetical protein
MNDDAVAIPVPQPAGAALSGAEGHADSVTIRAARPSDAVAIARLASLDSAPPPPEPLLLAEVAGEVRAAISLYDGSVVANPFAPSAALVELLEARARQLRGGRRRFRQARRARHRARRLALG